jgi:hypothetical protein
MASRKLIIDVEVKGAQRMTKQVKELSKSLDSFFRTGEKHKIPKKMLLKMLDWQIERKRTHPEVDINKIDFK